MLKRIPVKWPLLLNIQLRTGEQGMNLHVAEEWSSAGLPLLKAMKTDDYHEYRCHDPYKCCQYFTNWTLNWELGNV